MKHVSFLFLSFFLPAWLGPLASWGSADERPASPKGGIEQRVQGASSPAQLREALNEVTQEIDSLLAQGDQGWERRQRALDSVDRVVGRAHDLDEQGEKVADLLQKAAELFTRISEANAQQMEEMASRSVESEEEPEKLYESEGWMRAEFISSMARYRLSKTRYYWALALKDRPQERSRLLQEALTGFSPQAMEYRSPELISYCRLGRALCYRELGKPEEALKELEMIDKVDKKEGGQRSPVSIRASQERVNLYISTHRYREGLQEINRLLVDLARSPGDPNGLNRAKWLKVEILFSLISQKGERLEPQQIEEYHQQALSLMQQLAGPGKSWREQGSQLLMRNLEGLAEARERVPGLQLSPFEEWLLAERAFSQKKYPEALSLYQQVVNSHDPEVQSGREQAAFRSGICRYQLGQLPEAASDFSGFISRFPQSPEVPKAAFLRYKAYETLYGDRWNPPYLEATRYFLDHFPSHPSASEVRYRLGRYHRERGERLRAAEELGQVREDSSYSLDARFLAFRSYAEEIEERRKAGGAPPLKGSPPGETGGGYQELYPRAIAARKLLSGVLADRLRDRSINEAERTRMKEMGAYTAFLAARVHTQGPVGGSHQVIEELQGFEETYPEQADLFLPVGLLRIEAWQRLGDSQGARREVESFIQRHQGNAKGPELFSFLADQFQQDAKRANSQGKTSDFKENSLTAALLYYELALNEHQLGSSQQACKILQSTLALYPNLPDPGLKSRYLDLQQEVCPKPSWPGKGDRP